MRKLITKGEIADMLDLSKSQVRFYEKKGLLKPKRDDNGYAMYDFNDLDKLELVILLKELHTPLKEIKKIMNEESAYDYPSLLKKSHESIVSEIDRLNHQKKILEQRLSAYAENEVNTFKVMYYEERLLYMMHDTDEIDSIKNVYDLMKNHEIRYLDYENELYIITTNKKERIGFMNIGGKLIKTSNPKETLAKGNYFSFLISYSYDEDFSIYENRFRQEAKKRGFILEDELIFIDHFGRKFYEKHRVIGTIQARIISM